MSRFSQSARAIVAAVALVGAAGPAAAHHAMGGATPATAWQGLLSGLGHPIIGLDHLAFTVGIGLMSWLVARILALPLLFVSGTVVGCAAHIKGLGVPFPELAVVATLVVAAAMLVSHDKMATRPLLALFAGAGFFHGYAYAESIIGAETAPLVAYVIGFAAIQYAVALASAGAAGLIVGEAYVSERKAVMAASGALAVVAAGSIAVLALT